MQLLRMCQDYDVNPTFLTKDEVRMVFSDTVQVMGGWGSASSSGNDSGPGLGYEEFVEALSRIAIEALSKPVFSHLYPTEVDKVGVLLEMWGVADPLKLQHISKLDPSAIAAGHVFYPPGSKAVDIADNSNNGLLRDIFSGDDESKAGGTNAKVKLEALGGVGSAAEVRLQGVSIWLEGVIKDINEDGTFEVSFNNGDRENGVPFHRIRAKGALRLSTSYGAVVGLSDDSIEDADLSLSWLQFNATKDEFYRERLEVCRLEDQPAINAAHQNLERKASSQCLCRTSFAKAAQGNGVA
eukprot:g1186.t1